MDRIKKEFISKFRTLCYENKVMATEFDDPKFLQAIFFNVIGSTGEITPELIEQSFKKAFKEWFNKQEN